MRKAPLTACLALLASWPAAHAAGTAPAAAATPGPVLDEVVAGPWRTPAQVARDPYRHPVEALTFWGLRPGMTILEVQPGAAAYWTEILAPYAKRTGGRLYVTGADLGNPELSEAAKKSRAAWEARFAAKPDLYGSITVLNWGAKSAPLPKDTFDLIVTARNVHNWMGNPGMVAKVFGEFYAALKPGGVLGLEEHRANPGPQDPTAENGYVTEAYVIEQAEKAGFKLAGKSEINANPKDTKDHPFGVWTLPPSLRSSAESSSAPDDPNFDHSKYIAIGESDRMTLRFVK
ncbi:MAG: methyltransferase domain-containing protein [Steroidobacteraceae bacterium]